MWYIIFDLQFLCFDALHKHGIKSLVRIFKRYGNNLRVKNKFGQNILEIIYLKTLKIDV